jgi:hypothetical protein
MNKRDMHVGKSRMAREAYSRYIRKLDYDPTVDEPVPFSPSNESGEELSEPTSKRKRKASFNNALKDHFSNNLMSWLVSGVLVILFFLMFDSKVDLAKISTTIDTIKENVASLVESAKNTQNKDHEQDLALKEHSMQIIQLEKENERNKTGHK